MQRSIFILVLAINFLISLQGQNEQLIINPPSGLSDRVFTFDNPKGSVKVTGYDGELIVVTGILRYPEAEKKPADGGLRRIEQNPVDIRAEVNGRNVLLLCNNSGKTIDFDIKIPSVFSLKLKSLDNGNVDVLNIRGEIEIGNNNGNISLENITGAAILGSVYGDINASFTGVKPGVPMMFTSFEGSIYLSFPATLDANLRMKSDKGEILSDFDITPIKRKPVVRQVDNTAVYSLEEWVTGAINKGGPEFVIQSYSGKITLKKK